jgi:hypothetical protein
MTSCQAPLKTLLVSATLVASASAHGSMITPRPRQAHGQTISRSSPSLCNASHPYSNASSPGYYCGLGCLGEACLYYAIGCFQNSPHCSFVGKTLYPVPEDLVKAGNPEGWRPPAPTLGGGDPAREKELRTYNVDDESVLGDWTAWNPWRAPGTSGKGNPGFQPCGVNSGSNPTFPDPPAAGQPQFANGTDLPSYGPPTTWKRGDVVPAEWSIYANHGGGYSYRLCKKVAGQPLTEACYQQTPLEFADDKTLITYYDGSRAPFEIDAVTTSVGTWPAGSQWRKNPVPMCGCDIGDYCTADAEEAAQYDYDPHGMGRTLTAEAQAQATFEAAVVQGGKHCNNTPKDKCGTQTGVNTCLQCGADSAYDCEVCCPGLKKIEKGDYSWCSSGKKPGPGKECSKENPSGCIAIPYNTTHGSSKACPTSLMFDKQWDDGTGGGVGGTFMFSMTDKLKVPSDLEAGEYSLSWRWDCEQTPQVWNSCADVTIE